MGSQTIQFLWHFPVPICHNCYGRFLDDGYGNTKICRRRCFSGGGSRWDWEKNVDPRQRSRFTDSYVADDYDEEVEYSFRNGAKGRIWWSDDFDAEDDDEDDEGFGILEASIGFDWVFKLMSFIILVEVDGQVGLKFWKSESGKVSNVISNVLCKVPSSLFPVRSSLCIRYTSIVMPGVLFAFYDAMELALLQMFRAFGWMIPAVIISLLLGTGPNAIIMALALPLAQSALSLAAEALLGRADEPPRPRPKSKKRPFAGATNRTRVRKEKEVRTHKGKEAENYKSWVDANNVSTKNEKHKHQRFNGWDELDNQPRVDKEPRVASVKSTNKPRGQEAVKISRRTKGDTPLFMRLLIAMFPYLGFWTKLF
ncbi:UNVERIFIED_CONTAM: hypothetical protein Slati_4284700 [Sesamum latifolium]|uniref:Uncharacterized protein n=1 Tax=Sesamum latifolium TaxID=2727402 RepID=A0AAW2TDB1_9LAMI